MVTTINLTPTPFALLGSHLLDLTEALEGADIPLVIVGGFGLFLRQARLQTLGLPPLYADAPAPRATEDFDVVLKLRLLADVGKMQTLRAALDALGYAVAEKAQEYQFIKPETAWGGQRNVKVDLLARLPEADDPKLHRGGVRVMPKKRNNPLHAFLTPEAIAVEEGLTEVTIQGKNTAGQETQGTVSLPAPYALYLMKLFAFRDEERTPGRERYARKHVLDLYTLTACITAEEYAQLPEFQARYGNHPVATQAGQIVAEQFGSPISAGAVRLLEAHPSLAYLPEFLAVLAELFPD